ncbi:hypothetical protein CU084_18950 [Bacillus velezensis]|nr:hypothetical protein CU084_18950 [Bacillus velezensis]
MKPKKISRLQGVFFINQTQISIGILALPHLLMMRSGSSGWISILLTGLLVQLTFSLYMILFHRFPKLNLYEMLEEVFGTLAGKGVQVLYILYFAFLCTLILSVFTRILDIWVLPQTPNWVISLMLILGSVYIAQAPLNAIARFSFILTPFLLLISLPLLYTLGKADITYIMPIFHGTAKDMLTGVQQTLVSITGFQAALVIGPLINCTVSQRYKILTISNILIILYYLYITLTCFVTISPEEIKMIPEPVLYLLKTVSFRIIERTDLLFLTFWFVTVFSTLANVFYLASTGIAKLFNQKDHSRFVYPLALLVFLLSIWATSTDKTIQQLDQFFRISDIVFVYLFPLFMVLIVLVRKRVSAMRIKKAVLISLMCASLTLAGCWDQNLLKDISLVLTASLDVDHDGKNKIGITYRKVQSSQAEQETGGSFITTVLSASGHTIREARFQLDKLVDQRIDTSKQRVLLIGEKMAEKPLFPYLDVFYRDPKSPLLAHPAVVKDGEAIEVLKLIVRQKLIVSKYLTNLLTSANAESNISMENLQSIRSSMLTADKDFALPYLSINGQTIKVEGSALFSGQRKVTEVLGQDSTLLTLLSGQFNKSANINLKLWDKYKMDIENYLSLGITDATRKIVFIDTDPQHIKVKIRLKLNARVLEYPKDKLNSYTAIDQINKQASANLNSQARSVISHIQEHNSDILGIGRKYQTHYYERGKLLNWRGVYPSIEIIPDIKVSISQIGIVN